MEHVGIFNGLLNNLMGFLRNRNIIEKLVKFYGVFFYYSIIMLDMKLVIRYYWWKWGWLL